MPRRKDPNGIEAYMEHRLKEIPDQIALLQKELQLIQDIMRDKHFPVGRGYEKQGNYIERGKVQTAISHKFQLWWLFEQHQDFLSKGHPDALAGVPVP